MVLSYSGGRLLVRGRCGLTSTMSSRSGSRPARSSSSRVPPTWRERFTAPLVGRCRLHHHHPGREPGHDRPHLPEAPGHELDLVAQGALQPLRRSEEAAAVADPGLGEDVVEVQAQRAAELQVLPVVAGPERRQEGVGDGRAEPEPDPGRPGGATPTASSTLQTLGMGPTLAPRSHSVTTDFGPGRRGGQSMTFGSTHTRGRRRRMTGTPSSSQTTVLGEWRPPPSVAIFQFRSSFRNPSGPPTVGTSGPAGSGSGWRMLACIPDTVTRRNGTEGSVSRLRRRDAPVSGQRKTARP